MQQIFCYKCGKQNFSSNQFCIGCGTEILKPDLNIENIKQEIQSLKSQYESSLNNLLNKLDKLEQDRKSQEKQKPISQEETVRPTEKPKTEEVKFSEFETEKPVIKPVKEVVTKQEELKEEIKPIEKTEPQLEDKIIEEEIIKKEPIVEKQQENTIKETSHEPKETIIPPKKKETVPPKKEEKEEVIYSDIYFTHKPKVNFEMEKENEKKKEKSIPPVPKAKPAKEKRKSAIETLKSNQYTSLLIEEIGSPFVNLWSFTQKVYTKYKEKNQLPVFFMTLSGIIALLFGFGYLMQLSFGYFGEMSESLKIGFGFVCSTGITVWATKLYKKGVKYKEFSSALIGLSIILNYLFIYFLSDLPPSSIKFLQPTITGFGLIMANTIAAIIFALRYETRIVAVLSLFGGAFAPFYLNSDSGSVMYFAYLWLLCLSSIYIARKIKWETLGTLSFVVATAIVELAVFANINEFEKWEYTAIFHAFAYLFVWFALFKGKKVNTELSKISLLIIAGNLSFFLFNLYFLFSDTESYSQLGIIYFANALPFFPILWFSQKKLDKQIKLLLLVIAGTFVGFGIPALFDRNLLSMFWSIEALVLVFMGFNFSMVSVRKEGYFLLLVAIGRIYFTLEDLWYFNYSSDLLTKGYFNLAVLGAILILLGFLLYKFRHESTNFEKKLLNATIDLAVCWFMWFFVSTVVFYTYHWLAFITVVPVLALITAGYIYQRYFFQIFGYFLLALTVFYSLLHGIIFTVLDWNDTLLHIGFVNFLGIGLFLGTLLLIFKTILSKKDNTLPKPLRFYTSRINTAIAVWFMFLVFVTTTFYIHVFLAFIIVPVSVLYLYWGKKQSRAISYIAYVVFAFAMAYAIYIVAGYYSVYWKQKLLSPAFFNLIGIGVFLIIMRIVQPKIFSNKNAKVIYFTKSLNELIAIWFTVFFLITGLHTVNNFTFNLAIVPMFAMIYIGHKTRSETMENLGLGYSIIIALAVWYSVQETGSYRFSGQTLSGKIALGEIMLCLWGLKLFYTKLLHQSSKTKSMDIVREVFYWIVPLVIISPVRRHFPDFIPTAIWASVLINFVLYELTKRKSLRIEFVILTFIAAIATFTFEMYYVSMPVSVLVLAYVFVKEKAYNQNQFKISWFKYIFTATLYYVGTCILFFCQHLIYDDAAALFITAFYFMLLVYFQKKITPIQNNFRFAFWLSLVLIVVGLIGKLSNNDNSNLIYLLPSILFYGIIQFGKQKVYAPENSKNWLLLLFIFHGMIFSAYLLFLNETLLTITIIVHAIVVLFNSMKAHCKKLVWQSVALFATALIKLYFWDIAHFTMTQKVIVFVVIGALLIGASFLFMRIKEKYDEKEEVESLEEVED